MSKSRTNVRRGIKRTILLVLFVAASTRVIAAEPASEATGTPNWVWTSDEHAQDCQLSREFVLEAAIHSARLKLAADFCQAEVEINGRAVIGVAPYCQLQSLDVTDALRLGPNRIDVRATRVPGPPAVALSLAVSLAGGQQASILTDNDWTLEPPRESDQPAGGKLLERGSVPAELWGVGRRDISLSPLENYEQWQQAKTEAGQPRAPRFWTAPGFEVTELHVATPDQGSWVSMAFDRQGRLTVAREDKGFLRFTLDAKRASIARTEAISAPLEECRGLAYDNDRLYANANNSLALYRLQLTDDGRAANIERIREFPGKVGHGRNDLALSSTATPKSPGRAPPATPKVARGAIYSIHGDSVDAPAQPVIDFTSPLNESRRKPPRREGHLLRMDLESRRWELLAHGLRNPYGIAIHASGDPFTFDADNEYDMGMPWYRPTRILHLTTGGDNGYRDSTGTLPPRFHDQPDHAPPLLDIGRSSPTAIMFGSDLAFPPPYRRALFALDWTYGRVLAIHLAMRGSTWRAHAELFLQGHPLNVTDVATGPDGAMYLITGGRKTQSALYVVRHAETAKQLALRDANGGSTDPKPDAEDRLSAHEEQARAFSESIRPRRRSWETLGVVSNSAMIPVGGTAQEADLRLREGLGSPDPVLRHAARIAMERGPLDRWRATVLAAKPDSAALVGLMALARARLASDAPVILDRLARYPITEFDLTSQFTWVRACGLLQETAPDKVAGKSSELVDLLLDLWTQLEESPTGDGNGDVSPTRYVRVAPEGDSRELGRRIALLLGDLRASELPEAAARRLLASSSQEDQVAGLVALRSLRRGWTNELRRRQWETLNEMPRMIAGQGLPSFEAWLRKETRETLSADEKVALADLLEPTQATASDENLQPRPPRDPLRKWRMEDLASLLSTDGNPGDAERGLTVFREALCGRCHRVALRGPAVGPDLTFVSRRFSRRDILESIVSPSLSVAENYRLETIVTESGQVHTGRIVNEGDYRSPKIRLATDSLRPDLIVEIDKTSITEHRQTGTSPMPDGLVDGFSLEEIRDLLVYLESGGRLP